MDRYSDEARSDEDYEEDEAFSLPLDGAGRLDADAVVIESVVGDVVDGDVAVVLPSRSGRGALKTEVDGTDYEAIFDEESREVEQLEEEWSLEHGAPPDLVELSERHRDER